MSLQTDREFRFKNNKDTRDLKRVEVSSENEALADIALLAPTFIILSEFFLYKEFKTASRTGAA